jgi:hypothetical protein
MSRIATLTAALSLVLAPAALAGPHDAARHAQTQFYLRHAPETTIDLRSPDAREVFVPSSGVVALAPAGSPDPSSPDVSDWGVAGILMAALVACGALAVLAQRRAGPPAHA